MCDKEKCGWTDGFLALYSRLAVVNLEFRKRARIAMSKETSSYQIATYTYVCMSLTSQHWLICTYVFIFELIFYYTCASLALQPFN